MTALIASGNCDRVVNATLTDFNRSILRAAVNAETNYLDMASDEYLEPTSGENVQEEFLGEHLAFETGILVDERSGRVGMARIRSVAIALAAVALLSLACGDNGATSFVVSRPSQTGISVSGRGSVVVVPDIAVLTLGVEVTAPTVAVARSEAAAAMKAVRVSLEANAIDSDDIKTLSFSIQPQYPFRRDERSEITGYKVSNRVSVKVRDLDAVSDVLDDAAEAGGDAVRINGISFTVDEPEQYESDARKAAVEDARKRAEELAALAGVTLGKVLSISESGASIPFAERSFGGAMVQSAAAPRTPISPGETEISHSVSVVYKIE